jgi:threonine dehydratase
MWPLLQTWVDESIVVRLEDATRAMRTVADRIHVIAEGAAACAVAAASSDGMRARGHQRIVAVVSGGNIDLERFAELTRVS